MWMKTRKRDLFKGKYKYLNIYLYTYYKFIIFNKCDPKVKFIYFTFYVINSINKLFIFEKKYPKYIKFLQTIKKLLNFFLRLSSQINKI